MIDVNLLPKESEDLRLENGLKHRMFVVGIIATVLFVGAFVLVFSYSAVLAQQESSLNVRVSADRAELEQYSTVASNLIMLKKKIKGFDTIEKMRFDFVACFDYIVKLFSPQTEITKVTIEDSGKVVFGGQGTDSDSAARFIHNLSADPMLKQPKLLSLRRSEEGISQFEIEAIYGKQN